MKIPSPVLKICMITSVLMLLPILSCYCQQTEDKYDFRFQKRSQLDRKWFFMGNVVFSLDSTLNIKGYSPFYLRNGKTKLGYNSSCYQISQYFHFVKGGKNLNLSLLCKSENLQNKMEVAICDDYENVIQRDTVSFNNTDWNEVVLDMNISNPISKYFSIRIFNATNDIKSFVVDKDSLQKLWIASLSCKIDGKDLCASSAENQNDSMPIIQKDIITYPSINEFKIPKQLLNCKMIGVCETMHSNLSINAAEIALYKDAITNHNCKLLLQELPLSMTLSINAYINARCSRETAMKSLTLSAPYLANPEFIDFVDWLRSYNDKAEKKVRFLGMDIENGESTRVLFDFLAAYYTHPNRDRLYPIMREFLTGGFKKAIKDSCFLKSILPVEDYNLLMLTINNYAEYKRDSNILFIPINELRDSVMFKNLQGLISTYAPEEEDKVLLFAHFLHLKKKQGVNPVPPLGNYLAKMYRQNYGVCVLTTGNGFLAMYLYQKDKGEMSYPELQPLQGASIEKYCGRISNKPFSMCTQYIPDEYDLVRYGSRDGDCGFYLCNLHLNADLIYYIPQSSLKKYTFAPKTLGQLMNERFSILK